MIQNNIFIFRTVKSTRSANQYIIEPYESNVSSIIYLSSFMIMMIVREEALRKTSEGAGYKFCQTPKKAALLYSTWA